MRTINQEKDPSVLLQTFGTRLQQAITREGISQTEFARRAGVAPGSISELVRGLRNPSAEFLVAVKTAYGISSDWLLTGEGTMLGKTGINLDLFKAIELQIAVARAATLDGDLTAQALLLLIKNGKTQEIVEDQTFSEYLDRLCPEDKDADLAAEIYNNNLEIADPSLQLRNMLAAAINYFETRKPVNKAARLTGVSNTGHQFNTGSHVQGAMGNIIHHHYRSSDDK
jgi:transcriptional regulator with XRE-family HTH domain